MQWQQSYLYLHQGFCHDVITFMKWDISSFQVTITQVLWKYLLMVESGDGQICSLLQLQSLYYCTNQSTNPAVTRMGI